MGRPLPERLRSWERFTDITALEAPARSLLLKGDPWRLADALNDFFQQIVPSSRRHGSVALIHYVLQPGFIPYERARALYECALDLGHETLCLVLVARASGPTEEQASGAATPQTFVHDPIFDEMPLGTRKWKARLQEMHLLQRLVHDPDPSVVRLLLDNPRIQVKDVQSLACRRPNRPAVLSEVLAKHRWWPRYPVLSALIQNPYTPLNARVALLPLMHRSDLRDLAAHAPGPVDFNAAVTRLLAPRASAQRTRGDSTDPGPRDATAQASQAPIDTSGLQKDEARDEAGDAPDSAEDEARDEAGAAPDSTECEARDEAGEAPERQEDEEEPEAIEPVDE